MKRKLPLNDKALNRIVFKNAGVSEGRCLTDYFNLKEVDYMLENGIYSQSTKNWLCNALDFYMIEAG